jgi:methylated-DNA-[protein]-cysteine S-methyltransferase
MLYDIVETTLGPFLMAGDDQGLRILSFLKGVDPVHILSHWKQSSLFMKPVKHQLFAYLNGDLKKFDLSLCPDGTLFQKQVWSELEKIPYGKTMSYQGIAHAIGKPNAARAVGLACGKNPIPIIIPCHRVIGKNGSLTGYSSGIDLKKRLLYIEGCILS